jgi:hypothetical protein
MPATSSGRADFNASCQLQIGKSGLIPNLGAFIYEYNTLTRN